MERSFAREVELLKLGRGETFVGEGILAVTKALLQSGVAYVGGYQGSPITHLLDVMVQAKPYLDTLGVHVEPCTNEAAACAMLAASVNYPLRGAVTWKAIVGTNVASDALSNIASPGVVGGALIVVGEDYGEGSSVIQERSHAFAMKSSLVLLDPRPELAQIVRLVEHAFPLSEAAATPVMLQLRIRACHLQGSFECRDNVAPAISTRHLLDRPAPHDPARMSHPPATFAHERLKVEQRLPAARRYIEAHGLNEELSGSAADVGLVVQGGIFNSVHAALAIAGLTGPSGASRLPILVLNATYPLVPGQIERFAHGKRALLVLEEGHPEFIEFEIAALLARAGSGCALRGKALFANAGEYHAEAVVPGLVRFVAEFLPDLSTDGAAAWSAEVAQLRRHAAELLAAPVPPRPPGFCIGCPERPVFAAMKLVERELGPRHVASDIGCHSFAMFEPFHIGNTITGYGMGLASAAGVRPLAAQRPLATVGDGGFWHNAFLSGVTTAVKNATDAVLLIFKNGYTSATGTQDLVSTPAAAGRDDAGGRSTTDTDATIEGVLQGVGVKWLRSVHTYDVAAMKATLADAFTTREPGLKVIVAEGECQLERQRRLRPWVARQQAAGARMTRVRFGIDGDICSGDQACIRLSGCPSLTLAAPLNPLREDPITTIDADCVGCGLCGANAQAAALCPSFYRVEVVTRPRRLERFVAGVRERALRLLLPS